MTQIGRVILSLVRYDLLPPLNGKRFCGLFGFVFLLLISGYTPGAHAQEKEIYIPGKGENRDHRAMRSALIDHTGYYLGSKLDGLVRTQLHICAAKIRYKKNTGRDIAQLYCSNRKQNAAQLVKFWVNFTTPALGHKAWKINLALPGDRYSNASFIDKLQKKFGRPRTLDNPRAYTWNSGNVHLILKEDQFGLQVELWDRSLNGLL